MKKNKRGSHAAEPSKSKLPYFILFIIFLFIIFISIYLNITYIISKDIDTQLFSDIDNLSLSDTHIVENSNNLISKDFSIHKSGGISNIKGKVENSSNNTIKELNLVYTLYDNYNNIVYEFEISVSKLEAHSSSSFSSACTTNLSNVTSYSVRLAEWKKD